MCILAENLRTNPTDFSQRGPLGRSVKFHYSTVGFFEKKTDNLYYTLILSVFSGNHKKPWIAGGFIIMEK